jgi:polysaccharide export outer membrane protein
MKVVFFLTGALLLACSGCSTPKYVGRPGLTVLHQQELPPPAREDLILRGRAYLIGPLDRLSIDVYGVPDLTRAVQTDASGNISMPLVGTVEAAGRTPSELAGLIQERLRGRYVRNPQVTVNLTETVSQVITVDGEVEEPGLYPVVGRMTLTRAVATAKGLSEFANASYVVVTRRVNNQDMAALYDMRAIRRGIYPDPEVFANDVVTVGESPGRRVFKDVLQGSGLLTAPIIAILQ